ncbi:hypothetical protein U14_02805 [Candidatus Moduliflexus flocculans]|uniref:DUF2149 domain-containing protein n=1 Tax=Candidatus Moduliflexus flocculans TaxID=1499966 RepID=A0A081BME4_9BACT|nr:hypothetical protein U14_02805 [Candidatus Moduliflexus flocculans]
MAYFIRKRRLGRQRITVLQELDEDDDPLSGMANMFDLGVVFIVGLLIAFFAASRLQDMFQENAEFTMMKQSANGELEIITKTKKQLKAVKVSKQQAEGRGERLGTAYKLEDGTMVYVPE